MDAPVALGIVRSQTSTTLKSESLIVLASLRMRDGAADADATRSALAIVTEIYDEDARVASFVAIAPHVEGDLVSAAFRIATGFAGDRARAAALRAIANSFSDDLVQEAIASAATPSLVTGQAIRDCSAYRSRGLTAACPRGGVGRGPRSETTRAADRR